MANTYYDSELTGDQIEQVLIAIDGLIIPSNNGKVVAVQNGRLVAKSVSKWSGESVLEPLSVIANGDYYPGTGIDGFDEVHVAVPSSQPNLQAKTVTQNGIVLPDSGYDGLSQVTVDVSGGGGEAFVESQATSYFDTDVVGNTIYGIVLEFMPITVVNSYQWYAGATNNNFTIGSMATGAGVTSGFVRCGNTDLGKVTFKQGEKNIVSCESGKVYINGVQLERTYTGAINTTTTTLKLLGGNTLSHSRLFRCRLYDQEDILIHDYVPFLDQNFIACLKDIVTNSIIYGTNNKLTYGYTS